MYDIGILQGEISDGSEFLLETWTTQSYMFPLLRPHFALLAALLAMYTLLYWIVYLVPLRAIGEKSVFSH